MNTPAQCGVIKPPKTDIYSEAPQSEQATTQCRQPAKHAANLRASSSAGAYGSGVGGSSSPDGRGGHPAGFTARPTVRRQPRATWRQPAERSTRTTITQYSTFADANTVDASLVPSVRCAHTTSSAVSRINRRAVRASRGAATVTQERTNPNSGTTAAASSSGHRTGRHRATTAAASAANGAGRLTTPPPPPATATRGVPSLGHDPD